MNTNYHKNLLLSVALLLSACGQTASAFYNPALGRWLNRDPIGNAGSINHYAMIHNSPVTTFDVYGLRSACQRCNDGCGRYCKIKSGPDFIPEGPIQAALVTIIGITGLGANFDFNVEFEDNKRPGQPCTGCCEVRYYIKWSLQSPPHAGFPPNATSGDWYEDRDRAGSMVGHRGAPRPPGMPSNVNQYLDSSGNPDPNCGVRFSGHDFPIAPLSIAGTGQWFRFKIEVIDNCVANAPFLLASKELLLNW